MKYKFQIFMTEQDYIEFNLFHMLKSHYKTKISLFLRLLICLIFGAAILFCWFREGFGVTFVVTSIVLIVIAVLFNIFLKKYLVLSIKLSIKNLIKKGRGAFSPVSTIEFFEDYFVETTETNRNEQKYSSIERISAVYGRAVYLHINSVMAYIIPMSSFENEEQYNDFLNFSASFCSNIDIYKNSK